MPPCAKLSSSNLIACGKFFNPDNPVCPVFCAIFPAVAEKTPFTIGVPEPKTAPKVPPVRVAFLTTSSKTIRPAPQQPVSQPSPQSSNGLSGKLNLIDEILKRQGVSI